LNLCNYIEIDLFENTMYNIILTLAGTKGRQRPRNTTASSFLRGHAKCMCDN